VLRVVRSRGWWIGFRRVSKTGRTRCHSFWTRYLRRHQHRTVNAWSCSGQQRSARRPSYDGFSVTVTTRNTPRRSRTFIGKSTVSAESRIGLIFSTLRATTRFQLWNDSLCWQVILFVHYVDANSPINAYSLEWRSMTDTREPGVCTPLNARLGLQ